MRSYRPKIRSAAVRNALEMNRSGFRSGEFDPSEPFEEVVEDQEGQSKTEGIFRREGEFWTIAFDRHLVRLRDAKGLRYIAALLRQPGTKIHSADLTGRHLVGGVLGEGPRGAASSAERERLKVTQRIKATLRKISQTDPALGDHLGKAIRTGLFCRYDPKEPVSWDVS